MNPIIEQHFSDKDLDLRKKYDGYSRFMDQKVTPDVLSFIADCVLNLPNRENFTVRDIWQSEYFRNNTMAVFSKPDPQNETAHAEYDKFIGQPLKALSYARVLSETKVGNRNHYSVLNPQLLEFISLNVNNTFEFIYEYVVKVLGDSDFLKHFHRYHKLVSESPKAEYFFDLKDRFGKFIRGHTQIRKGFEPNRIFPKVLNPYAVRHRIPGTARGRITPFPFVFSDLMYNRKNFRDLRKDKSTTRQEAFQQLSDFEISEQYSKYLVPKAKRLVRDFHQDSEVKDQWARGEASHIHHIFPESDFPEFAAYPENLIKLTPEQHLNQAHPGSYGGRVNVNYQLQCLLAKSTSIENALRAGKFIYSQQNFIHLLNKGLGLDLDYGATFPEIRERLTQLLGQV